MSKSNTLQSILVAATLGVGSAQAEAPKAPEVVATTTSQTANLCEGGRQKWSAKDGFVGCIDSSAGENNQSTTDSKKPENPNRKLLGSAATLGLGEYGSIGVIDSKKYGTGVRVEIQAGVPTFHLGAGMTLTPKQEQALINAGFQINEHAVVSFGVAKTQEDAKTALNLNYSPETKNLEANQQFVKLDFSGFGPVATAAVAYIKGNAKNATLRHVTETSMEVRVVDLPALVETWNDFFAQTTTTIFHGHKWENLFADATFHIGENGALTFRLGTSHITTIDGDNTSGIIGAKYEHYMGDAKAVFAHDRNMGVNTTSMGYETRLDKNWSMGGRVERVDGRIRDTRGMIYFKYSESVPEYERPLAQEVHVQRVVGANTRDPILSVQDVGSKGDVREHIGPKEKTGETLIDQAPKAPLAVSNLRAMVQSDGSVIISFDDAGQIPGVRYLCSINGGSDLECSSGTRFAANMFTAGRQNTIEIYALNNAVAGKPSSSKKVGVGVMIYSDNPTNTLAPELISLTYNTLSVRYRIADADTVTGKSCQLVRGTSVVSTATPDTAGICTFSVSPETVYEVRTVGYANILGPDGKITTQYVETHITVTTPEVPNTPPTAVSLTSSGTLTAGSLTVGQVVGTLSCTDAESGNNCSYTTTDSRFTISGNTLGLSATGVSLGAGNYTVPVTARDPQNAPHNGNVTVSINDPVDVTAPSLTSSSNLGASNIGTTVSHTLTFDETIGTVSVGTLPTGMTVIATKSGSSVTLDIATDATFTAFGSVTIPVTVSDTTSPANSGTVNVTKTVNDVPPVAGGAFATLADMTVSDAGGFFPITINAGGVSDPLGRSIAYSATGLPTGVSIDSLSGVISGVYDANTGVVGGLENFNVTITASNGSSQIQKSFVLTVRDDG